MGHAPRLICVTAALVACTVTNGVPANPAGTPEHLRSVLK